MERIFPGFPSQTLPLVEASSQVMVIMIILMVIMLMIAAMVMMMVVMMFWRVMVVLEIIRIVCKAWKLQQLIINLT